MKIVTSYTKVLLCLVILLAFSGVPYIASAQGRDIELLRDFYHHKGTSLDGTMKFLSDTYIPINAAVPLGQLIYGYARHDQKAIRNGWQSAGGLAIAVALEEGSRYIIDRRRPYETHPDIIPYKYDKEPSMPSGHTTICFATATSLSLEYPKWYVIAPSYLYACAVAYSRLYLGQHYPSDIVVGALVGSGAAYLSYQGMKWLQHRKHKKQSAVDGH